MHGQRGKTLILICILFYLYQLRFLSTFSRISWFAIVSAVRVIRVR